MEHGGALRRAHARAELGGHDPGQVHDLERVLEHVLPVARPEAKTADDLLQLLVERPAVRLEDRLLAGLPHDLFQLRLRLVVRLLDPRRMDPAVLDELRQRQARDLAAEPVEGRQHNRVRRVIDDEVDAGEVLERADVATLAADDAALHVVGRDLDHGDRRLCRVARGDALQRVGDEVPRPPLRLCTRLLLEHAHAPCELVAGQLLPALEQLPLRLLLRQPGDALERLLLRVLQLLQLVLERAEVRLAVGDALIAARELDELALDLLLLRNEPLLDLHHRLPAVAEVGVDLGSQLHRLLACFDLRLAADGLGFAVRVLEDLPVEAPRLADARRAEHLHGDEREHRSSDDSGGDCDADEHGQLLVPMGCRPSAAVRRRDLPMSLTARGRAPPGPTAYLCGNSRRFDGVSRTSLRASDGFGKTQFAGKTVDEAVSGWYLRSRLRRNLGRFHVEATRRQPAGGAPPAEQLLDALGLRLQARHRSFERFSGEALVLEPEPDCLVSPPPCRERPGPRRRRPGVVQVAVSGERLDRVVATRHGQPLGQCLTRQVPMAEHTGRPLERSRSPQLPRERPRRLAVEAAPDEESRPDHRVGGKRPPPRTVELDVDAAPRTLPQRGDGPHAGTSTSTSSSSLSFAFGGLPFVEGSSSTGRSRADTTCSGPMSSWMRCRICCVTSGCSRRNAVAFCRPWPRRSSPKLKYEPDFVTTLRSRPVSRTVPSHEMPEP